MGSLSIASPSVIAFSPNSALSATHKSSFHVVRIPQVSPTSTHSAWSLRTPSSSSSPVVMMAKRQEELKEIREKTTEQINEEVVDLKGELFMLRLQRSARNEFKSSEFGRMRKRVARMLTVKREREIEEGINKRQSRKMDRQWKKSIVPRPPPSLLKLREEEAAAEAKEPSSSSWNY